MFWVSGLLLLPLLGVVRWLPQLMDQTRQHRHGLTTTLQEVLRGDRGTVVILVVSLMMGLGLGMAAPFINLALQDRGGTVALAGLLYAIIAGVEAPVMHIERTVARHLGDAQSLLLACGLYTLAYTGMALVTTALPMLFFAALIGMGFGLFYVGTVRIMDARAKAHQISTLQSFRNALAFGLAPLVAGPLGGWLYQQFGPVAVFATSAVLYGSAGVMLWGTKTQVNRLPQQS
jgi:PPP family 3-phenylpropionic acid transporter